MTDEQLRCRLYLVRHGEAKPKEEDPERGLTVAGSDAVTRVAAWAKEAGIRVEGIRHSGKRRAQQTADIFAEYLEIEAIAASGLAPNDDPSAIAAVIRDQQRDMMLVGHLPFLERLAALLTVGDTESHVVNLDAGALLELSHKGDGWTVTCLMPPNRLPNP